MRPHLAWRLRLGEDTGSPTSTSPPPARPASANPPPAA